MNANQYRESLARLGLSQVGAAPVLGVSPRTAQRYAEDGPSGPAARLVELLLSRPEAERARWMERWAD